MNIKIKMLWIITLLIGISTSALAGPNQDVGTIVGGVAGGLIGNSLGHGSNRAVATVGGAVVGSLIGNQVGYSADRRYYGYGPVYRSYPCGYRYYRPVYRARCYPVVYRRAYIGPRRVYRRTVITRANGNRIVRTYSYRVPPRRFVTRIVRAY